MTNYTELGFKKTRLSDEMWTTLQEFWAETMEEAGGDINNLEEEYWWVNQDYITYSFARFSESLNKLPTLHCFEYHNFKGLKRTLIQIIGKHLPQQLTQNDYWNSNQGPNFSLLLKVVGEQNERHI